MRKIKTSPISPTADFFGRAIALSGKTQREIAQAAGYAQPNIISMMKRGTTKIPIEKIPDLAEACGVDPALFMRVALKEYHPEILELIETYVGDLLTLNEVRLVDCYRAIAGEDELLPVDTKVQLAVMDRLSALLEWRKRRMHEPR